MQYAVAQWRSTTVTQSLLKCAIVLKHAIVSKTSRQIFTIFQLLGVLRQAQTLHPGRSTIFMMQSQEWNHFFSEGTFQMVAMVGDFYVECEHEICLPGKSRMLDFVFTCYQSLIFSKLLFINV